MVFCNPLFEIVVFKQRTVTILILIDGFLQWQITKKIWFVRHCHNPYFNRWFSAINGSKDRIRQKVVCHNPYFNRWFSAIRFCVEHCIDMYGHNPYFNRWFSAIQDVVTKTLNNAVTILILIDGFLQYANSSI